MSLPEETDILASNFQKFLATVLSKAQEDEGHSTQQPHFDLRNIDALLAQYSSQRTASEQALQKRTAIIQKLKGQAQKVLSRYRQLQTKYKELQEEQNATPKTVTDTVEPDGAACDSASQPTPQLITELQSETSCLKHEVAALQASQARQNEDSERQSQECNALQAKVAASTADKEKLQANLKRVQESLHAALEEAACAKKQAAAESVTAQDEVNSSTANEMDDLQHQLQEARAQLLEESDACTDLRARVSAGAVKLKQQSTELRRMHIKLGKVQEKLSSETASFKEERAKANAALVAAKTEAEKYMNVASSTGEKIASLEKTRAELLDETNTLRDQLHAAATTAVGFQREAAQTGSLQREISALKSTLETVEQQLEMENTIQLQTNSALTAAHVDMESQAEHFSEERERLQHELQKLKDSHAAQWALMSSRQEQDQVAEETGGSGSKDEFATLTAKNAELVRQLDDVRAQAQLDQLEMASLLREEQDRCEKEVSSYENRCRAEQQTELEEVKAQLEQCLDKNEQQQREIEDGNRVYFDVKRRLQSEMQAVHTLRSELVASANAAAVASSQQRQAELSSDDRRKNRLRELQRAEGDGASSQVQALEALLASAKELVADASRKHEEATEVAKAKEAEAQSLAKKNEELRCVVSDQTAELAAGRQQIATLAAKLSEMGATGGPKKSTTRWNLSFW